MVDNVTSFSRHGLRDWLVQRVSAVVIAIYSIILISAIVTANQLSYAFWHDLYQTTAMRVFSVIVLFSIVCHAWIGMWTVYTDYVKVTLFRLILQVSTILGLLSLLVWSVIILWS